MYLEGLTALRIFETTSIEISQKHFMKTEKAVIECENNITNLLVIKDHQCFIESVGKHRWRISSKQKPAIEIHVLVDEKTNEVTRLNWRQVFE